MQLTKLEYLRRFTQTERVTIREVAKTNPVLDDYMSLLELATDVDTSDPDTVSAVNMLEQAGLIGEGRAVEILGPVDEQEAPVVVPTGVATVYRIGQNFMTCLVTEQGPETYDEKWDVDALYYAVIQAGATLVSDGGKLAIAKQVG